MKYVSALDVGTTSLKGVLFDNAGKLAQLSCGNTSFQRPGPGMAIAKRIIDKHNGQILVETHLNSGTTIKVQLPISIA